MIALDTNILARFYVNDPNDPEAAKQRPIALKVLTVSRQLFVPLTVILELEWVLRAFYSFTSNDFAQVLKHLLGLPHVMIEEWPRVMDALESHEDGLDFADALHLSSSSHCSEFLTFDDKRFARRARKRGMRPAVRVPKA